MALQKHKEDRFGNGGVNYWRIVQINCNWESRQAHVVLNGYVSQQARVDGKQPLESQSFDWSGDDFPFDVDALVESPNVIATAYSKIKSPKPDAETGVETNWFADAVDC